MSHEIKDAKVVMSDGDNVDGDVTIHENWVRIRRNDVARWYPSRKVSHIWEPGAE